MTDLDLNAEAAVIKAAIQAAMTVSTTVYDQDGVPGTRNGDDPEGQLPRQHVVIELHRDDLDSPRDGGGGVTLPGRRLTTRCHAQSIHDVRELRRRVGVALEDRSYPLGESGDHIGPFVHEIGEPEDDDDAGWVGADFWVL